MKNPRDPMNLYQRNRATQGRSRSWQYIATSAALIAAGWFLGAVATRPSTALAQVHNAAPDQHFLAGDQLSLPLLQEMVTTLQQMDTRLAHLESIADRVSADRAGADKRHSNP
jgi:Tfp pilus assembly protein PilN